MLRLLDATEEAGFGAFEPPPPEVRRWRVLQPFVTPRSERDATLCADEMRGEAEWTATGFRCGPDAFISCGGFSNSFYGGYWAAHTGLERVGLAVEGVGACVCTVRAEAADGSVRTLQTRVLDLEPGRQTIIAFPLTGSATGRLFAEFGALDSPFQVTRAFWGADGRPRREVRVALVVCAYNREDYLLANLQRLTAAPEAERLGDVLVVNQGERFRSRALRALVAEAGTGVRVIEQPNLGGCGGFTRGVLEALGRGDSTHVLLMDDDVEVEPAHLVTAAAFAAHAREEMVVGGQMLDLFKRTRLFEAGTSVGSDNLLKPNHRNVELERSAALRDLVRPLPSDFNGWWFSLIPLACFREHGLPAPVFIRGDDQEFGVRLTRAGVKTVSLPPVSVWHEPFYAKPPGWQLYYDLRNRLIFASLYPDAYSLDGPVKLLKRLMAMLIRYDYQQTWSIVLALQDYLVGPASLDQDAAAKHASVMARLAAHAPERLQAAPGLPLAEVDQPATRNGGRLRLAASFFRGMIGRPRNNPAGADCMLYAGMPIELMTLGRSYVFSDEGEHFHIRFRCSARKAWTQLFRTSLVIARYALRRRRTAEAWRQGMPERITAQSWAARLGVPCPPSLMDLPRRREACA